MRACLFVTLCLVAGGLAGCTLTATQQTAKQPSSCLQDVKSSQEGQTVYAKLWASDATDTAAKLSDPNPLTPTERDALVQVHNNIISCRQMMISDRSAAWELSYWLDYFQRSDAIFNKLANGELPVGLDRVERRAEHRRVLSFDVAGSIPEPAALQRSTRCVRLGEEPHDDVLAAQLAQLHRLALVGGQGEVWRRIADVEECHERRSSR